MLIETCWVSSYHLSVRDVKKRLSVLEKALLQTMECSWINPGRVGDNDANGIHG
jgi:hypothetical protein